MGYVGYEIGDTHLAVVTFVGEEVGCLVTVGR